MERCCLVEQHLTAVLNISMQWWAQLIKRLASLTTNLQNKNLSYAIC